MTVRPSTVKDGDQVFARCDWKGQEGVAGTVTILGGAGKYAGIGHESPNLAAGSRLFLAGA